MARGKQNHPGFDAMVHKGKQHPGFQKIAKKQAVPVRGMGQPAAPAPSIAPVAPIGPPQMPGGIPGQN